MKSDCIEKIVTALGSLAAALAVPAGAMAATGSATGAAVVAGAVGLPLLGALAMGKPIWDAIRSDRRTACEAHIADGIRLARAGLEAAPDTRFGAPERAALDEAVADTLPRCLPTEEAQVREILTGNALNGARIAEALLGNMPQEALDGPFREEGARNFFRDVVVAVWESLRAEPDFTATLRSHIDEAFFVRLDRVESKIDRLGEGQDDIRAMIAQVLANQQAASPDGDERERQVANLLHVILEEHVPAKQIPGAIETAIARVREMRDQLGGAPNDASDARRALYFRAQEALRVFDLDAAETSWREYRRLGRQERADRAREDARTDALETGRIAETLRARLRYREAAALFAEAAATVDPVDADHKYEWLRRQWNALYDLGNEFGDNGALGECLTLARGMLDLYPLAVDADKWATSQNNLGNALLIAGQRETDTARLHDAVSAYRSALTVLTRDPTPHRRAIAQKNLGDALAIIGRRENDLSRMNDAVAAYREALTAQNRERNPVDWATTMGGIGTALHIIARRENDSNRLQEGIAILRDALTALTPERNPQEWAGAQINLGNALQALGENETGSESLESAIAAYRMALTVFTRERMPLEWAGIQTNLGGALRMLGLRETGTESLSKSVAAHRQALLEFTRDRAPQQWAIAQANLGGALVGLGERETGLETLEEAVAVLNDVLAVRSRESTPLEWAKLQTDLAIAYLLIASREGSREAFGPAVAACEDVIEVLAGVHPERQAKARQLLAIVLDRRDQTGEPAS